MRLFKLTPGTYEVEIEDWVMLIPAFATLVKKDKGSPGDYRGDKKLLAKKQLAYIYFCLDFTSPIREWDAADQPAEALRFTGLSEEDVENDMVNEAWAEYDHLLLQSAPSLKTLRSIKKGRAELDRYFENVDFEKRDKLGKAYYTPESYIANIAKLPMMNRAIDEYEKLVLSELKADGGIRGKSTLGGQEGKRREKAVWQEGGPPSDDMDSKDVELQEV